MSSFEIDDPRRVDVEGVSVSPDHFIGGVRVSSPTTFQTRTPTDWDRVLVDVSRGDADTSDLAVSAAVEGFKVWGSYSPAERAEVMHRMADLIDANNDEIAIVETMDMAFLYESMRKRLVARGATNFRLYADLAVEHRERTWDGRGGAHVVQSMPAGPAVIITPWNAPFMLSTWKITPALAAGNSIILKPAEWSPLSASLMADLAAEAGFPPGSFNVVQGIGEEVGAALVADQRVRRISFTGSPATARHIGVAAAKNIVPFTAELGGKGPLIIFADSDLDAAAAMAAGQFDDSGQVCLAGTRLLVESSIKDDFLKRFHEFTDAQVSGDPRDSATTMAPMVHPDHVDNVEGFVQRARDAGDNIVRGGKRLGLLGFEQTLIEPKSNQSEVVQSEIFGPVLTFQTFDEENEAIELANSTMYGLSALIFTGSADRAERVGRAVRSGIVWVNTFLIRDLTAPFGGIGISGIGREGGAHALEFHSDLKTLIVKDGTTS